MIFNKNVLAGFVKWGNGVNGNAKERFKFLCLNKNSNHSNRVQQNMFFSFELQWASCDFQLLMQPNQTFLLECHLLLLCALFAVVVVVVVVLSCGAKAQPSHSRIYPGRGYYYLSNPQPAGDKSK